MSLQNSRTEIDQLAVTERTLSQACAIQGTLQQSEVMDQSCILYSLPQELRDEIYKYTFEPRAEVRRSILYKEHSELDFASPLCYRSTVICALLPVSRTFYEEVWRLLVPARDQFSNLFGAMMQSKSWDLSPIVADFGPRIRYVCERCMGAYEAYPDNIAEVDCYLPENLVVLIDDYVMAGGGLAPVWTDPYFGVDALYDDLRCLLNLKTFNIEVSDTPSEFTPRLKVALQVGKMLLEDKSVRTVRLLFREKVQASMWQRIVEEFFNDINTKDVGTTSKGDIKSLVHQFDALETQPWAFENDMPWFSDKQSMKQVIRITRCKGTRLGSSAHDRRT